MQELTNSIVPARLILKLGGDPVDVSIAVAHVCLFRIHRPRVPDIGLGGPRRRVPDVDGVALGHQCVQQTVAVAGHAVPPAPLLAQLHNSSLDRGVRGGVGRVEQRRRDAVQVLGGLGVVVEHVAVVAKLDAVQTVAAVVRRGIERHAVVRGHGGHGQR